MRTSSSVVQTLIIVTTAVFLLELGPAASIATAFALWPVGAGFIPWQLITHAFLHGSLIHLAFNMYGLWIFGRELEYLLGQRLLLQLYFISILTAGVTQLLFTYLTGNVYPTVGASGGVFGILLAYGMFFPHRTLMLLFPPVALPAWLFVIIFAGIELMLGMTGTQAGVAHFAHLGGMVGGYLVIRHRRRLR